MNVGDRIKFVSEHNSYEIQAVSTDGRWVVATKPFNLRNTVIYTLIDTVNQLRGVDDSLGNSLGYETRADCEESLKLIQSGMFGYSYRRRPMELDVEWVRTP